MDSGSFNWPSDHGCWICHKFNCNHLKTRPSYINSSFKVEDLIERWHKKYSADVPWDMKLSIAMHFQNECEKSLAWARRHFSDEYIPYFQPQPSFVYAPYIPITKAYYINLVKFITNPFTMDNQSAGLLYRSKKRKMNWNK
jgi:hypothetical protein